MSPMLMLGAASLTNCRTVGRILSRLSSPDPLKLFIPQVIALIRFNFCRPSAFELRVTLV
jgi:hypothetical protein